MKLTTRSRYATRMLLDIAMFGGSVPVPVKDIARRQRISKKYLEKIIRELKRAGLIKSKRGPRGGHMLSRVASDIRLGDVIRALEGMAGKALDCSRVGPDCAHVTECLTQSMWSKATRIMFESLNNVTLADLLRDVELSCPQHPRA